MIDADKKKISLIVPFFNEEGSVEIFYEVISKVLNALPQYAFEVLCVDDGSYDKTLQRLLQLVNRDERFQVLELSRNFGKEAALTAGLDAATGNAVIPFDADLQDPPELIPRLIEEWEQGTDVVLACRTDRQVDSAIKRLTAKVFYRTYNMLSSIELPDDAGDFRLMDRKVVDALKLLPESQRFMKGLFAWVGFRSKKIPYVRSNRASGLTKFSIWRLWNLALEALTGFSTVPLRIWTYVGSVGAILTLFYALFMVSRTLIIGVDLPGYATLLIAILFLGCLQLISIGVLGEYVGRIYMESKQRPSYLIRKVYRNEP